MYDKNPPETGGFVSNLEIIIFRIYRQPVIIIKSANMAEQDGTISKSIEKANTLP